MRRLIMFALLLALTAAENAPSTPPPEPIDVALRQARVEAMGADAEAARLDQAADRSRGEAAQLHARQAAAAQAIAAAEARITVADAEFRIAAARAVAQRRILRDQQQPAASLLAGISMMAQRPPLLAIADRGGSDELVRIKVLLDSTLPVIRRRTAALSGAIARARADEQSAAAARTALLRRRADLTARKREFAALEAKALRFAERSGGQALGAGDTALAADEQVAQLSNAAQRHRSGLAIAAELSAAADIPARPGPAESTPVQVPFAYMLPSAAPVSEGVGTVSDSGVRARGLTLATTRGSPLVVPASGIVRFSGPFRNNNGVVIIDHGGGWLSMIVNAASDLRAGARVTAGAPLGRALGPIGVELSHRGERLSPAIIAGSSGPLSKAGQGR